MSALPPKADIVQRDPDVCFVPEADSCTATNTRLFDHLVGGREYFWWDVKAECRGSIEVDYKFKLG